MLIFEAVMIFFIIKQARRLWLTVKDVSKLHDPQRARLAEVYLAYQAKELKAGHKPMKYEDYYPIIHKRSIRGLIALLAVFLIGVTLKLSIFYIYIMA